MRKLTVAVLKIVTIVLVVSTIWIALPVRLEVPGELGTTLEDRNGLPLRVTRAGDGSRAGWIALDEMDPRLIQAFIALEDHRFYQHAGVDTRAVARAAWQAVRNRRIVSGASTITMQLARIRRPSSRGVLGKVHQMMWALRIDAHAGKEQILEHYLNRVPLGQGAIGVSAAAALYFDASAAHLSLGQAALLAGIASGPTSSNPLQSAERAATRRQVALRRMVALGYADAAAASAAAIEPVAAAHSGSPFLAPHFTSRLLALSRDSAWTDRTLRTSLDLPLQQALEAEVRHTVAILAESEVREGAAIVLDNRSGEILAWVGSPDFWSDTAGQVDMVASPRQPGSALKPFLYALAFDRGNTAATVLPDEPRVYHAATGPYTPRNYDRRYHGPTLAREALASSFNVPAVELTDRLGAASLLRVLRDAGMTSLNADAEHYGLGLALGNGDVTLLELANAYRGLANRGEWRPVTWRAIEPGAPAGAGRRFVSAGAALLTLDILRDPVARIAGFGLQTPFDFPFPVAVKTGTSHHFTDNWAVGVTGGFTVAVWVGNFSGRPMRKVSGVTGAGPLLHRAVLAAARRFDPGELPSPADVGAERFRICRTSGALAGAQCPASDEWFLPGTHPVQDCASHTSAAHQVITSFAIVSPKDGDRYDIPPGVDARYATVPLRATGAQGAVRWLVNGEPATGDRLVLKPGTLAIAAQTATGQTAQVTVVVR